MFRIVGSVLLLALVASCARSGDSRPSPTPVFVAVLPLPTAVDPVLLRPIRSYQQYLEADANAVLASGNAEMRCKIAPRVTQREVIDVHALSQASKPPDCRQFQFRGRRFFQGKKVDVVILRGRSSSETVLDFTRSDLSLCGGKAIAVEGEAPLVVLEGVTLRGGYGNWANAERTVPSSADTSEARQRWNSAVWTGGANNLVCFDEARIEGFYYGIHSVNRAWAYGNKVIAENCGDACFFAYDGGRLHLLHAEANYSSNDTSRLGFGLVAETLHWNVRRYNGTVPAHTQQDCRDRVMLALGLPQYVSDRTSTNIMTRDQLYGGREQRERIERILKNDERYHACLEELSLRIPLGERSFIYAVNVFARGNRVAGAMANFGSDIFAKQLVAHGSVGMRPNGARETALDIRDPRRPNDVPPGGALAGMGVVARYGSRVRVDGGKFWDNQLGVAAFRSGGAFAAKARVWDNALYGFLAVRKGYIDGAASWAFGPSQKVHFAVQQDDPSAIYVAGSLTPKNGERIAQMPPFTFISAADGAELRVVPSYVAGTIDFLAPIVGILRSETPRLLFYYRN